MTTLHHDLNARCAPQRIWELLADLESVGLYNPAVRSVAFVGAQRTGIGALRACEVQPKGRVVERVTHWEEGRAVGLEVAESDWPIHFMRWITRVEPADGGARLTQVLEYKVKFGLLGLVLDRLVMRRKLRGALDQVLGGLIRLAEGPTEG